MAGRKDVFGGKFGSTFEAKRWLSLDVCGLAGVTTSFSIHIFAFSVIASHLIEGSFFANAIFLLVYTPVALLAVSSLVMAWTTDPGAVPMGARPLVTVKRAASGQITETNNRRNRALRRCHKCNDNYKPTRAHHDSVTGRCIVKFDHFCPWVGNAVGAMNHKFFVLFVFYTMCSCLVTVLLMVIRAVHCGYGPDDSSSDDGGQQQKVGIGEDVAANGTDSSGDSNPDDENGNGRFLWLSSSNSEAAEAAVAAAEVSMDDECFGWHQSLSVLILLVVSIVFMIFTCCMLVEQIEAIATNSSKIARMKMRVGQAGTELSRVTEEFNEMFGGDNNEITWHWFLPLPVEFPRGMKKVVLGYEWDETFDPLPFEEPNNDEEAGLNGKIELTSSSSRSPSPAGPSAGQAPAVAAAATKKLAPASSSKSSSGLSARAADPTGQEDGEEGTFSGTPVVAEKSTLTKRGNSRGPNGRDRGGKSFA